MPEHLEKMRTALETCAIDQAPSLQNIEEILGAFSSTDDGPCPSSQIQNACKGADWHLKPHKAKIKRIYALEDQESAKGLYATLQLF